MQIKRNYREPFFRQRRNNGRMRLLVLSIVFVGVMGLVLVNQPQIVQETLDRAFGEQATPTPLASTLATRASNLFNQGDIEGAATLYESAIAQRDDNINYLYEYGQLLVDLNRPDEALQTARRIIELAPSDVRGYSLRALAQVWRGEFASAIPVALTGLEIDENFAPLYVALSRAYTGNNDWRDGVRIGEEAVILAPNDMRSHWAYANALTAVGAYDEAIAQLETAIDINPTFLPPYFELAFLYLSQNRDQEAIDIYDRILGVQPRNGRALLRQCEAYIKIGEFERALGLCQDSVTFDPDFAPAQFRLGVMYYTRRDFQGARDAFAECVRLDEDNLQCVYRLGLADYYLGECDAAWTQLQDALIMAQAQGAATQTIDIIRQGLSAISTDPACPGYGGLIPDLETPTPEAEVTPDITPATST
jgi:tetratricopeptide (TPR) repeat protein